MTDEAVDRFVGGLMQSVVYVDTVTSLVRKYAGLSINNVRRKHSPSTILISPRPIVCVVVVGGQVMVQWSVVSSQWSVVSDSDSGLWREQIRKYRVVLLI